uniref:Uncharacterized protein n=1 Tax=Kalanchoe fedtschenkoi TaxID=63787 RepID=A0A7N0VAB4_KALFE
MPYMPRRYRSTNRPPPLYDQIRPDLDRICRCSTIQQAPPIPPPNLLVPTPSSLPHTTRRLPLAKSSHHTHRVVCRCARSTRHRRRCN